MGDRDESPRRVVTRDGAGAGAQSSRTTGSGAVVGPRRERPTPPRLPFQTMTFEMRRPGLGTLAARSVTLGLALALTLAPRLAAQSAPTPTTYGPSGPGGHYHEGLTGDQLLVVERNLKCNCGCGLDVHSCQFQMQCEVSPGWTQRIRRDLEAGMTPEAIQASFVADYGMTVLMAPPPEGFNLVGYLLPGFTILAAGTLIVAARGRMKTRELAPVTEVSDEDAERLRAEWQKLDKSESPDW